MRLETCRGGETDFSLEHSRLRGAPRLCWFFTRHPGEMETTTTPLTALHCTLLHYYKLHTERKREKVREIENSILKIKKNRSPTDKVIQRG